MDFLWESGIAKVLRYKRKLNSSLFSKTRKYAENGVIETLYDVFVIEKCIGRRLRLTCEDSTDIPAFFIKEG